MSWHQPGHWGQASHWHTTHQEENMSCVCFDVWALGLFLITEVSLSLDHEVNRPGLWPYFPGIIIIIIIRYYPESRIRSLYTVDNVLLTLRADTLMQCNDKYLYFRQIFNVIPPSIFRLCLYLCVITSPVAVADDQKIVKNGTHRERKETKWVLFSISTDSNISVTVCNSKPCVLREAGRELSPSII